MLDFLVDMRDFQALRRKTIELMARGTARAVKVALDEGADYARKNFRHTRRTGEATSPDNVFGVLRRVDMRGAEGELVNMAPHARFLEEGTKAHDILPLNYHWGQNTRGRPTSRVSGKRVNVAAGVGRGMALRFTIGGRVIFRRHVRHPGTRALPFMQPAAEFAGTVIERETETVTFDLVSALWE